MLVQGIEPSTRVNVRCDIHRQKYECRKHVHHFAELVFVMDGALTVTVNGKEETATENQFIFLFPFQKHQYTSDKESYFLICTFPMSLLSDFAVKSSGKSGKAAVFNASALSASLFKQKIIDTDDITPYGVNSCLYAMLDDFSAQVELTEIDTDNSAMDRLVYYVNDHYKDPLPLYTVAQELGYSSNYLSHCVFKTLGMNYRTFLGSTRAEHAKMLLRKSELSVLEIAFECGYPNVRSFQRHFKSLVGVSPSEYRAQLRGATAGANGVMKYPRRIRKDVLM